MRNSNTMNQQTMTKDRENHKRLLQELERLSDEGSTSEHHNLYAPSLHDASLFSASLFSFSSDLPATPDHSNHDNSLVMDLQSTSHNPLMYESLTPGEESENQQLQVDHNGTKVFQLPYSSAWLSTRDLTDVGTCVSTSTSSSSVEKNPSLSPACIAAAATAAMIVIPNDHTVKRPRSQIRDWPIKDEGDEEDHTTEASHGKREDPTSPRSISDFPKGESPQIGGLPRKEGLASVTQERPSLCSTRTQSLRNLHPHPQQRSPVDVEKRMVITLSLDSSRDPDVCRKRRAEAMERFRRKKAVRSFGRKVRYQIRKRIATTRPRVNGRFARKCDAESQATKTVGRK